jgi:two-component system, cell cycle response regulator DivK
MKPGVVVSSKLVEGWSILIVDDIPDNLMVAKTALKFHGAAVSTASNGEDGLYMLEAMNPTAVLVDIRMPKMDGWALFRAIRENPAIANTPIIAITAYAMDSDRDEILNAGFDGYLSKPFDMFTFVQDVECLVRQALEKRQKSEDVSV